MSESTTATAAAVDLQKFCQSPEKNNIRFNFHAPWVRRGWRYATDGTICIRIPAAGAADTAVAKDALPFPPAFELFEEKDFARCATPWPAGPCFRALDDCPECWGVGEVELGDAEAGQCSVCAGKGRLIQNIYRHIRRTYIAARLDKLIAALPGARFWDEPAAHWATPVMFAFDGGGQGLVMPRNRHPADNGK